MPFCFSNAQSKLATPWEWTCCCSPGECCTCHAAAAKRRSWRMSRREKAQVVMESSWILNSPSSCNATSPTVSGTSPPTCTLAVAKLHMRFEISTGLTWRFACAAGSCRTNSSAICCSTLHCHLLAVTHAQATVDRFAAENWETHPRTCCCAAWKSRKLGACILAKPQMRLVSSNGWNLSMYGSESWLRALKMPVASMPSACIFP
mmetsp:Transcript_36148/g.103389  ORF Transcript_36148/g.103389 Transcript_36148/m.103389 type:complete len:205 (+) Transcript_36148:55-669(+)